MYAPRCWVLVWRVAAEWDARGLAVRRRTVYEEAMDRWKGIEADCLYGIYLVVSEIVERKLYIAVM